MKPQDTKPLQSKTHFSDPLTPTHTHAQSTYSTPLTTGNKHDDERTTRIHATRQGGSAFSFFWHSDDTTIEES
jgi:hypothetical protein